MDTCTYSPGSHPAGRLRQRRRRSDRATSVAPAIAALGSGVPPRLNDAFYEGDLDALKDGLPDYVVAERRPSWRPASPYSTLEEPSLPLLERLPETGKGTA